MNSNSNEVNDIFKTIRMSYPNVTLNSKPEDNITNNNDENYLTKLLLADCNCGKCSQRSGRIREDIWCDKNKKAPHKNVCIEYETGLYHEWAMEEPLQEIFYLKYKYSDIDNEDS